MKYLKVKITPFSALLMMLLISGNIFSQGTPKTPHHYYTFVSGGLGLNSIRGNNNYLSDLKPRLSYYLTVKEEWQYNERINFLLGLDFISSGCSFNSYYFKDSVGYLITDSVRIYDKNFNHGYKLRFNQFNVPILLRVNFFDKKKDRHCFYADIGPSIQFLIPSRIEIKNRAGKIVESGSAWTVFDNTSVGVFSNMMINTNFGIQFYRGSDPKGFDLELNLRYSPNRTKLKEDYAAKNLYFSQLMIGISAGVRF